MPCKTSWQVRLEGERAYACKGYNAINENPYPEHGTYEDSQRRRYFEEGVLYAEQSECEQFEYEMKNSVAIHSNV